MGPKTLWPEKAKKSAPSSCTFTGMCGVLCAPSTTMTAPFLCAMAATSCTGYFRPRTFDTCVIATIFVRSVMSDSICLRSTLPSGAHSINFSSAPVWRQTICHGSRLLWCSMMDTSTSSPALTCVRP